MALVKQIGEKYCVLHSRTKKVIVRKGRRACFSSPAAARRDANKTICRNHPGSKACARI